VNSLERSTRRALSLLLVILLAALVLPIGAAAWQVRRVFAGIGVGSRRRLYIAVSHL